MGGPQAHAKTLTISGDYGRVALDLSLPPSMTASPSSSAPSATSSQMFPARSPAVFIKPFKSFRIVLQRNESRLELKKADTSQSVQGSVIMQIFKFHPTGVSLLVVSSFCDNCCSSGGILGAASIRKGRHVQRTQLRPKRLRLQSQHVVEHNSGDR